MSVPAGYTLVHGTRAHKSEDETNRMPGQAVSRGCISSSGGECLGSCLLALLVVEVLTRRLSSPPVFARTVS